MNCALAITLMGIALTTTAATRLKPEVFGASGCPVTFEVPVGWKATVLPPNPEMEFPHSVCSLALQPTNWEKIQEESDLELNDLAIEIQVIQLPFKSAAEAVGLEEQDGEWTIVGRAPMPATPFETRHVLLSRDSLSVAATAYWDSPEHPVFESVVTSLKLKR